jgi:hypothetical protein
MIAKGDKVPSPGDRLMCGVRYMDSSLRIDAAISHILVTSIWLSCESSSPFPVLATCRASASSIFATSTAAASRTS